MASSTGASPMNEVAEFFAQAPTREQIVASQFSSIECMQVQLGGPAHSTGVSRPRHRPGARGTPGGNARPTLWRGADGVR